ncbi:MAG: hypothetical protein GMKNLPBB_02834 [Myxococcota bacterium]|nr:hypothetical protein [Myxococcota bacterium]
MNGEEHPADNAVQQPDVQADPAGVTPGAPEELPIAPLQAVREGDLAGKIRAWIDIIESPPAWLPWLMTFAAVRGALFFLIKDSLWTPRESLFMETARALSMGNPAPAWVLGMDPASSAMAQLLALLKGIPAGFDFGLTGGRMIALLFSLLNFSALLVVARKWFAPAAGHLLCAMYLLGAPVLAMEELRFASAGPYVLIPAVLWPLALWTLLLEVESRPMQPSLSRGLQGLLSVLIGLVNGWGLAAHPAGLPVAICHLALFLSLPAAWRANGNGFAALGGAGAGLLLGLLGIVSTGAWAGQGPLGLLSDPFLREEFWGFWTFWLGRGGEGVWMQWRPLIQSHAILLLLGVGVIAWALAVEPPAAESGGNALRRLFRNYLLIVFGVSCGVLALSFGRNGAADAASVLILVLIMLLARALHQISTRAMAIAAPMTAAVFLSSLAAMAVFAFTGAGGVHKGAAREMAAPYHLELGRRTGRYGLNANHPLHQAVVIGQTPFLSRDDEPAFQFGRASGLFEFCVRDRAAMPLDQCMAPAATRHYPVMELLGTGAGAHRVYGDNFTGLEKAWIGERDADRFALQAGHLIQRYSILLQQKPPLQIFHLDTAWRELPDPWHGPLAFATGWMMVHPAVLPHITSGWLNAQLGQINASGPRSLEMAYEGMGYGWYFFYHGNLKSVVWFAEQFRFPAPFWQGVARSFNETERLQMETAERRFRDAHNIRDAFNPFVKEVGLETIVRPLVFDPNDTLQQYIEATGGAMPALMRPR